MATSCVTGPQAATSVMQTRRRKLKLNIMKKLNEIKSKKRKIAHHSTKETHCAKCNQTYVAALDNKRHGRWVGCENADECRTWVHRKCIGFTEADVDKKNILL
jgi:ssDNA-binding Zn-finger/Zn-ribbon topoisomerase 1